MNHSGEYLSIVGYFARRPPALANLVGRCLALAESVLGNVKVRSQVFEETSAAPKRIDKRAGPLKRPFDLTVIDGTSSPGIAVWISRPPESGSAKDRLFWLDFSANPVWGGKHLDPFLGVHFFLTSLTRAQLDKLNEVVIGVAEALSETRCCYYGLSDIGDVRDTGRGGQYASHLPMFVRFQQLLARAVWTRTVTKDDRRARGIFWGNFFGPDMADRLGGARFVEEFSKLDDPRDNNLCTGYPDGSLLVRLTSRVDDAMHPHAVLIPNALERAVWLHQRFRTAELIC